MIIAGYAGVGKSEFCKAHVDYAIDFICMPFKYENFYEVSNGLSEGEDIKANSKLILREHWEMYYYWALKYLNNHCPEKYIVIPTIKSIMRLLKTDGIPYSVVYPSRDCKEEYRERYIKRGNTQAFLDIFIERWDDMLDGLNELGGRVIELREGQYLSDVIKLDEAKMSKDFGVENEAEE